MKTTLLIVAGIVLAGGILWAGMTYPKFTQSVGGVSPVASSFDDAKFAGKTEALTSGATSTSILNSGNDRYVDSVKVGCYGIGTSQTAYTGTGLVSLQVTVATTSTNAPSDKPTATAFAAIGTLTFATATPTNVMSSSTVTIATSTLATIWHSGEYMTFWWNATNTAACTVGVNYFGT